MILQITLRHSYFGGETEERFYIGPDEIEAGADIASHLREVDRLLLHPFTAKYVDNDTIRLTCRDRSSCYSVWEGGWFESPCVTKPSRDVEIEGQIYNADHEVRATVKLLPHIQSAWDTLKVNGENKTALFGHECLHRFVYLDEEALWGKRYDWLKYYEVRNAEISSLTLRFFGSGERIFTLDCFEKPEIEDKGLNFSLIMLSSVINEWDSFEEKPLSIRVDNRWLKEAETDCDAAYLLAEKFQEEHPEALDVIARYMRAAYDLGSPDAEEWLRDYLSDDGRYDAYC